MKGMKIVKAALLALVLLSSSTAFAAPKGAGKIPAASVVKFGSTFCGLIKSKWVPGTKLKKGFFYPRTAQLSNLGKEIKSASGSKKSKLSKKLKGLKDLVKVEKVLCSKALTFLTPTATSTSTAVPSNPVATATPTVTATPTATAVPVNLVTVNPNLYYTEHAIFIIPSPGQVDWNSSNSWDSLYSSGNMDSYINTLKTQFPADYFFVTITASNLLPERAPNVLTYRRIADGIGQDGISGVNVPNICRYHVVGNVNEAVYGVLDHEIGHNWGVFLGTELGEGHWRSNSNATGQVADAYSDDSFTTIKRIQGNPTSGFTWIAVNNLTKNETEIFDDRDLYVQGLENDFPELYVLTNPVYNNDGTVSYSAVNTYDKTWVEARNGVRNPSYQTSPKRFKLGFIYVARDLAEIEASAQYLERSIRHYVDSEVADTNLHRFQIPFLVATKFRGSVDALLQDLDGNTTPSINITGPSYQSTSSGSATFNFTASDPDGVAPVVSCVPLAANCVVSGNTVTVSDLPVDSHFFTIKAQDSGGKKSFAHFVVDRF